MDNIGFRKFIRLETESEFFMVCLDNIITKQIQIKYAIDLFTTIDAPKAFCNAVCEACVFVASSQLGDDFTPPKADTRKLYAVLSDRSRN
jgi:hypothetical protein